MKKARSGLYAVYGGKEFGLATFEQGKLELISHDPSDLRKGFAKYLDGVFVKPVKREELSSVYSVTPCAKYQGFDFGIFSEGEDSVLLTTDDPNIAKRCDFKVAEKGVFERRVPRSQLEKIWEVTEPMKLSPWPPPRQ